MNTENTRNFTPSPMFWVLITIFSSLCVGVIGSAMTVNYFAYTSQKAADENVLAATATSQVASGSLIKQIFSNIDVNMRRALINIDTDETESRGTGQLPDGTLDEGFMNIYNSRY